MMAIHAVYAGIPHGRSPMQLLCQLPALGSYAAIPMLLYPRIQD